MQNDTLSSRIEAAHIDAFCEKLQRRVAIKTGVEFADDLIEEPRFLGLHPMVFVLPALLAAVLMIIDSIGA